MLGTVPPWCCGLDPISGSVVVLEVESQLQNTKHEPKPFELSPWPPNDKILLFVLYVLDDVCTDLSMAGYDGINNWVKTLLFKRIH